MPTGYTSSLYDGPQSFRDYALQCARAFGACVELRDEPLAPAPDSLPVYSYHETRLAESRARLAEVEAWTDEQAEAAADAAWAEAERQYSEALAEVAGRKERYSAALAEAKAWTPPTPDHQKLKDFMIEQIEMCWDETELSSYYKDRKFHCRLSAAEVKAKEIKDAKWNIKHHEEHHQNEVSRNQMRNAWLQVLHASLPASEEVAA